MLENEDTMQCSFLGTDVGMCSGWNECDTFCIIFYKIVFNTKGKELFGLDSCDALFIDFERGVVDLTINEDDVEEITGETKLEKKIKFTVE